MHETTNAVGEFTKSTNFISPKYLKNAFIRACPGLEIVLDFLQCVESYFSGAVYMCKNHS